MNPITEIKRAARKMANRNRINRIVKETLVKNDVFVLDLIFNKQLFDRGMRADNLLIHSFKPYKPSTIAYKKRKGQPTNRVTLKDTGESLFRAKVKGKKEGIEVFSTVDYFEHLEEKYGEAAYKLTDNHIELLTKTLIIPAIVKDNKRILNK